MPNISSMEPQILIDLLALSLEEALDAPEDSQRIVAVVSAWFSNVELTLNPSGCYSALAPGLRASSMRMADCLARFCEAGWDVRIGVLKFGQSTVSGLQKDLTKFNHERALLKRLLAMGAGIYLCPNLHAKGIITQLGVITGSTNYTNSGLHLQMQNANYFPYDHPDYASNRETLLACLDESFKVSVIP